MKAHNFPWFPFYPADWFSSGRVKILTLQEKGAYFELLLYAWKSDACALPKDEGVLKRLVSWPELSYPDHTEDDPHNFQRVLDCFEPHPEHPDMLCNPRLYQEWLGAIDRHRVLSQRGKKGAKKRWQEASEQRPANQPKPQQKIPPRKIQDRSGKGFTKVGSEIQAVADKHFPPI